MMDNKLKVFKAVVITESFSRAAKQLHLTQPAVSKTIKNLEEKYHQAFFDRKANKIELTNSGQHFFKYVEQLLQIYAKMEVDFKGIEENLKETLFIGASTTIGNYILPQLIAQLEQKYPHLKINLITGNTHFIQQLILKKQIDFGIVEGHNHNTRLHYDKFVKDELVLVGNTKYATLFSSPISLKKLEKLALVQRELGSGSREVIERYFSKRSINLGDNQQVLGGTESIKNYLMCTDKLAFLSIHSVAKELIQNQLHIVEIENLNIERWFYFIQRQGEQSKRTSKIKRELILCYNKKE